MCTEMYVGSMHHCSCEGGGKEAWVVGGETRCRDTTRHMIQPVALFH